MAFVDALRSYEGPRAVSFPPHPVVRGQRSQIHHLNCPRQRTPAHNSAPRSLIAESPSVSSYSRLPRRRSPKDIQSPAPIDLFPYNPKNEKLRVDGACQHVNWTVGQDDQQDRIETYQEPLETDHLMISKRSSYSLVNDEVAQVPWEVGGEDGVFPAHFNGPFFCLCSFGQQLKLLDQSPRRAGAKKTSPSSSGKVTTLTQVSLVPTWTADRRCFLFPLASYSWVILGTPWFAFSVARWTRRFKRNLPESRTTT